MIVDEWRKNSMKKNDEENNQNNQQKSNDWFKLYEQDKLIRWMKRNEWIKWFGDWLFQTDWSVFLFHCFIFTIYRKMPNQELTIQKEKCILYIKNLDKIDQKLPRFFCVLIKKF